MRTTPDAYKHQQDILNKVKWQYEPGTMRRTLCEIFKEHGQILAEPVHKWQISTGGFGGLEFIPTTDDENLAIKELRESGRILPTFEDDIYGIGYRYIHHFDDVRFGMDKDERIIIFDLSQRADMPEDLVIRPDEAHKAAIERIRKNIEAQNNSIYVDPNPIQLRGGPTIHPIVTDRSQIELRKRQNEFHP